LADPHQEKRAHPRAPIKTRCWCEGSEVTLYVQMGNVSEGGAFLCTHVPLPVGAQARVQWGLPGGDDLLEVVAEVVWARDSGVQRPPGMGLRFLEPPEWVSLSIRRYVEAS